MIKYALLLFIVSFSVYPAAAQDTTGKRAQIDAVMKCVAASDLACVVDLSTKGIETYPTDGGFRYTRGAAYLNQGKYSEALADENKAIELMPQFSDAFYIRAIVYETGYFEFDKALADLSASLKIDPGGVNALSERGKLYKFKGQLDLAEADFEKIRSIDPSSADAKYSLSDISDMRKTGFNTGPTKDNVLLLYTEYVRKFDNVNNKLKSQMDVVAAAMDENPVNIVKLCSGVNGMAVDVQEMEKFGSKLEALLAAGRFDKIPNYGNLTRKKIDGYKTLRGSVEKLNMQFQCNVHWTP
jgi:tetratricopeptide (TPR) repeat protein